MVQPRYEPAAAEECFGGEGVAGNGHGGLSVYAPVPACQAYLSSPA